MSGFLIDGTTIAKSIYDELMGRSVSFGDRELVFVRVGESAATDSYLRIKQRAADMLRVQSRVVSFPESVSSDELVASLVSIQDAHPLGVVVQLPLPDSVDTDRVLDALFPEYDVDILGQRSKDLFLNGSLDCIPPVPGAFREVLLSQGCDVDFLHTHKVLVVGKGRLVGGPTMMWLDREGVSYDSVDIDTPSFCSQEFFKEAHVIMTGVGKPCLITPDMISDGVLLLDAGVSRLDGHLVGDVDPVCCDRSGWMTPVPGGIGPITVALLFRNMFTLYDSFSD